MAQHHTHTITTIKGQSGKKDIVKVKGQKDLGIRLKSGKVISSGATTVAGAKKRVAQIMAFKKNPQYK